MAKGGEKLQFDYGVYLLNKNIAQVSNPSVLISYLAHGSLLSWIANPLYE